MADSKNPSDVRFGTSLMRSRKNEGRTQAWLAARLGCSSAHIGNVENGHRPLQPTDVREADEALNADGRLLRLHKDLYQPEQVDWLDALHGLQKAADIIREYHNFLIPGILQTPEYARAVIRSSAPWFTAEEVEAGVDLRQARSEAILANEQPRYHVVLDDAIVLRPVSSASVMKDQFSKLAKLIADDRVILQVYPWGVLPQLGLGGPFSLLSSTQTPDVLHVESVYVGQTSDDPGAVRHYGMLFSELQARARSPAETLDLLRRKIEELR